ncbi:hypothetical protein L7F22_065491 [Adiantum nelumboides]|nr:hypothetical protein [Adiantum nelumboides]
MLRELDVAEMGLSRLSQDVEHTEYGRHLIDMGTAHGLLILNGLRRFPVAAGVHVVGSYAVLLYCASGVHVVRSYAVPCGSGLWLCRHQFSEHQFPEYTLNLHLVLWNTNGLHVPNTSGPHKVADGLLGIMVINTPIELKERWPVGYDIIVLDYAGGSDRYLREDKPHGSAGGLYNFRDWLMEDDPTNLFVMNCDVCCSFPLSDMLVAHSKFNGIGTLLVKKVSAESASEFGELVADPETGELLHYAEKPETFVSEWINCGVYIFTPQIFLAIQDVASQRKDHATMRRVSSFEALQMTTNYGGRSVQTDFVRLDQDILTPLAGKKKLYTFETNDFWEQIKTPGMSLRCSALYLAQYRQTAPEFLAKGDGVRSATYIGDVYVHPSAKVHPTAKYFSGMLELIISRIVETTQYIDLCMNGCSRMCAWSEKFRMLAESMGAELMMVGPNVSISANARVGPGVRLIGCILLDGVEVKENAVIMHSIVGWKSSIGRWARVQGIGNYAAKLGITILGEDVSVEDEVVVTSCIVLPHKTLNMNVQEEIIL